MDLAKQLGEIEVEGRRGRFRAPGQPFIEHSISKLERLKRLLPAEVVIEVDGGIDVNTAPRCAAAGASLFVAGSAVFGAPDPDIAYEEIERSVNG